MTLQTGQVLNQRYRIVKLLGQGGFGAVYRVWDIHLERPRALKENLGESPDAERQFKREAQLLCDLVHPNLPRVTDYFTLAEQDSESSSAYLVMDYVEGNDLSEMLDQAGAPLDEAQVLGWSMQICSALEYLHACNPPIIHRDIKPANIKITPDGKAILVDFGIAKQFDPHSHTTRGAQAVTPGYSPLEQYGMGKRTDARSDVFALAATLYHLLTNQAPANVLERMQGKPLAAPRTLNPAISPHVEAALLKGLALQAPERFQSMAEFRQALESPASQSAYFAPSHPPARSEPLVAQSPPAIPTTTPRPPAPARNLTWLWVAGLAILGLLMLSVVGVLVAGLIVSQKRLGFHQVASTDTPVDDSTPGATGLPLSIEDESGVTMLLTPAGEFRMGMTIDGALAECKKFHTDCQSDWFLDEEPVHMVYLDAFYIDRTEVTNASYAQFVAATGHRTQAEQQGYGWVMNKTGDDFIQLEGADWQHPTGPSSSIEGMDEYPVVQVSWQDAQAYCQWRQASLPSEAQWEKAARGTDGRIYPWGNQAPDGNLANFGDASLGFDWVNQNVNDGYAYAAPVGSYPDGASPYGLWDMAGNVWEWVQDWYQTIYYSSQSLWRNPLGPASGQDRVTRGGSWFYLENNLRTSNRGRIEPNDVNGDRGFRCARGQ